MRPNELEVPPSAAVIKWARKGEDREAQQKGSAETVNLWWELGGPLQR